MAQRCRNWMKFEAQLAQPCLVLESLNFGYQPHLSQLSVPQTQNFEIPLKNSGVKKFKNHFLNFNKMVDGSNFDKVCLLGISIQNYFQIWRILNFL
jgi:hypothetical protein